VEPLAQGYVSGLHSGGTDLSQQDLVVAPGGQPAPIQIVVHGSAASIQGVVKKDGSPVSQASILVVSDNPSPTAPTRLTASGTFTVSGLAPGAYHVYAFPSLAGIEYRNPEALLRYEQQASAVDLSENDTKQVEIQLITGIQP
jgi:sarcosine oxidase gamma subunit